MSRKSLVPIELPANPTNPLEAATKQYVDLREPAITATSTGDYYRGDKTFVSYDNIYMTKLRLLERGSSPTTPPGTESYIYSKSDGMPYWMGDDGVERPLILPIEAIHLNPGFEAYTGAVPDSWDCGWINAPGTITIDTTTKRSGAASVKMASSTGSVNMMSSVFAVSEGSLITFSFWAIAQTAGDKLTINTLGDSAGNADPNFFDGTSIWFGVGSPVINLTTAWTKYTVSYLVPANMVVARFIFGADGANRTFWIDDTSSSMQVQQAAQVITGEIKMWALNTTPAGYLKCDNTLYNVVDYPVLAALLGNTFGGVPGTTFGVPDMRDRFPIGGSATKDPTDTVSVPITAVGGSATITEPMLPPHAHVMTHGHGSPNTGLSGSHTHQLEFGSAEGSTATRVARGNTTSQVFNSGAVEASTNHTHTTTITDFTGSTLNGSGINAESLPPWRALHYIIKT